AETTRAWPKRRVRARIRGIRARDGLTRTRSEIRDCCVKNWPHARGVCTSTKARMRRCCMSPRYSRRMNMAHMRTGLDLGARVGLAIVVRLSPGVGNGSREEARGGVRGRDAQSHEASQPDHQAPIQAMVVAQFRDYHAEKFSGQGDPRIVDEWIQGLEFIFEVMECPDRYRVVCAQLQLTGDARLWWNAYWSMRPGEKAGCTWDMFKELVRDKYYPSYYRAEMERQFLVLQQGTRTVDEYEREFTRLAGFAPDL
ncbi:Unknown protein, partial [Striga hermonthica]